MTSDTHAHAVTEKNSSVKSRIPINLDDPIGDLD